MSHVTAMKVKVRSLDALAAGAQELGLELVRGQRTHRWFGTNVGSNPRDMDGSCDHAIRIPDNTKAYEVGIKDNHDGTYGLVWDSWNGGYGLSDKIGEEGERLQLAYTKQNAIREAEAHGWKVQKVEVLEKGGIRIECQERL